MFGGVAPLDVVKCLFLVEIDQHASIYRIGDARMRDFARLEDDIAVGQDHGRSKIAEPLEHRDRTGIQPFGERIIEEER